MNENPFQIPTNLKFHHVNFNQYMVAKKIQLLECQENPISKKAKTKSEGRLEEVFI